MSRFVKKAKEAAPDTAGKTEKFATRNVRLITFLVCIGIFLAVFGPISVFQIKEYLENRSDSSPEMTLEELEALTDGGKELLFSEFTKYKGDLQDWDFEVCYIIRIAPHYRVIVGARDKTSKVEYITVRNLETGEEADLLKQDVSDILS